MQQRLKGQGCMLLPRGDLHLQNGQKKKRHGDISSSFCHPFFDDDQKGESQKESIDSTREDEKPVSLPIKKSKNSDTRATM
jgi:hypothetical protein